MAFGGKDFFTVVEFGTSKISVVHCRVVQGSGPEVLGFAYRDSAGSIIKGEPVEITRIVNILAETLADADQAAGINCDRENVYCIVSGRSIASMQGEGSVTLYDEDNTITQEHIEEAQRKAMNLPIPPNLVDIDSFASAFVLDTNVRVRDPLNHTANRLDAFIQVILMERNKRETFSSILREVGFEGKIIFSFAGITSAYGTLTRDEKENGALLLDIGAGTIDYLAVAGDGVLDGGVLPVGMDNVANDLAIGLQLNIEQVRKLLISGTLEELKKTGNPFYELPGPDSLRRRIPVASIEKIINIRLQEIFMILKERFDERNLLPSMQSGLVLTGGGAAFPSVAEFATGVLGMHNRIAVPIKLAGAGSNTESPRFSAVLGSLQYIAELSEADGVNYPLGRMVDMFENITGGLMNKVKFATKVFSKK